MGHHEGRLIHDFDKKRQYAALGMNLKADNGGRPWPFVSYIRGGGGEGVRRLGWPVVASPNVERHVEWPQTSVMSERCGPAAGVEHSNQILTENVRYMQYSAPSHCIY